MKAKAIPTTYGGHQFRSRLEARWAVFFDNAGVKFEYEREGFITEAGMRYLPDFWLPDLSVWAEVKPTMPDAIEQNKAVMLAEHTGFPVFILYGEIPNLTLGVANDSAHITCPQAGGGVWTDTGYLFTECPCCGFVGIAFGGRTSSLACPGDCLGSDTYGHMTPKLLTAYDRARMARFEYADRELSPAERFTKSFKDRAAELHR